MIRGVGATKIAGAMLLATSALTGCAESQVAKICVSDEMQGAAKSLLFDHLLGDPTGVDVLVAKQAFNEVVSLDLIRFEGQDTQTRTVSCRARVVSPTTQNHLELLYKRQPEADGTGSVYEIELQPSDQRSWMGVGNDTLLRYRALLQQSTIPQPAAATSTLPEQERIANASPSAVGKAFAEWAVRTENERSIRLSAANGEDPSNAMQFAASEPQVRSGDLDGDGDADVAVLVSLCEQINCHTTTEHVVLGLFRNDGRSYAQTFSRVIEGSGRLAAVGRQGAVVETTEYGPDDPSCCPTQIRRQTFDLGG